MLIAIPLAFLAPSLSALPPAQEVAPVRLVARAEHRGRFPAESSALAALRAAGAVRWEEDYGSFVVAGIDERAAGGAARLAALEVEWCDEEDVILFDGLPLDGRAARATLARLAPEEVLGDPLDGTLDPDAGLYVVQFRAPVRDAWLEELAEAGAELVQYVPWNAYVVALEPGEVEGFSATLRARPMVQHLGVYEPAFRLAPALREPAARGFGAQEPITVQLVRGAASEALVADLATLGTLVGESEVGPYRNVALELDPVYFRWVAAQPAVFALEPRGVRATRDERQGQIVAGQVSGASPTGPNYLTWLAGKGFDSTQFSSFSVNVVDDATGLTGHPDLASGRVAFTQNPSSQSGTQGGHGFLNAHIVAGLNSGTGATLEDAAGYNYGLGIAPWARVGATAIFGPASASSSAWESAAYNLGARISTNSWGYIDNFGNPIPDYDSAAQEYDFLVRDARSSQSGNQEYTILFAAGNDGSSQNTVSTPGTAKNVLTVGASENDRQTGTDGCGIGNSGANDLRDIISFSSRGPVNSAGGDGRKKPEIVAPGTHVQAGVPQSSYNGSSVCNGFWPAGSTLYGWSSGTSHSTPAVAGGAALVRQWFLNQALAAPTPAMQKAVLAASAEYMTGVGANDSLWSNSQGFGRMNLERAFDGTPTVRVDQSTLLAATGQSFTTSGTIADGARPLRIALAWTDVPGPTTGAPFVNNLDLSVVVNGTTYRGNVFSGASSTTGGTADTRNNLECVFLPAGTTGTVAITVTATSIGGDGVPGNGDSTDQDFALLAYNVTTVPAPVAEFIGAPTGGVAPLVVDFTNQSTGSITSHAWSFGDGGSSTLAAPSHTYGAAGTYTVALTETGPGGANTRTRTAYIVVSEPAPVAEFVGTPTSGVAPLVVAFTNQSTGAVTSHAWSFGDGDTSTLASPSHTYNAAGTYTVALTETGPGGANTRTRSSYIVVSEPAPVAEFVGTPTSGVAPLVVSFTNQSTGAITSHAWSFGDGDTSTLASPSHTYSVPGTYTVALTETGPGGANTRTRSSYIVVSEPPPVADFLGSPLTGTAPLVVNFTDLSSGAITTWAWDFGDGGSSNVPSTDYTYTQPGIFPVTLTVSGPGGTDSLTRAGYVLVDAPAPTADFSASPTSGHAPLGVTFADASSGLIDSWVWDFGDGSQAFDPFTGHTYTQPGSYTVTLTVTGAGGSDSETKFALIDVQPQQVTAAIVAFPTEGTAPLGVQFQDASIGGATSWNWDFGDGVSDSSQHPFHVYLSPGNYTASLTINGGASSASQSILVHVAAQAIVRNGSGVNPLVYQSSPPILGQLWSATIDASAHPGAGLTMILVRAQPSAGIASPYGEILYNPASPKLFTSTALSGGATAFHSAPIPLDLAYEGLTATTQGVIFGGAGPELTNAVDLVLGF